MKNINFLRSERLFFYILIFQLIFFSFLIPLTPNVIYFFGNFVYGKLVYLVLFFVFVLLGSQIVFYYLGYKKLAYVMFTLVSLFNVFNWFFIVGNFNGAIEGWTSLVTMLKEGGFTGIFLFLFVLVLLVVSNFVASKSRFTEVLNQSFLIVMIIIGSFVVFFGYKDFINYKVGMYKLGMIANQGSPGEGVLMCNDMPPNYVKLCYYKLPFIFKVDNKDAYFRVFSAYDKEAYDFFLVGLSRFSGSLRYCDLVSDYGLRKFCRAVVKGDCDKLEGFLKEACVSNINGY